MPLVSLEKMCRAARRGGFAVGAFNFANLEVLQAIMDAATAQQAPLILQVVPPALEHLRFTYALKLVDAAVDSADLPIAYHLDHGDSFELCKQCVDSGFTSVMIDGSCLPFDENIELTRRVCDYAHAHAPYVTVEGELGQVGGSEGGKSTGSDTDREKSFTNPDQAAEFVEKTGCDCLAVACGTKHGPHKYAKQDEPAIAFDHLRKIAAALPDFPLALHGSSAVPPELTSIINDHGGALQKAIGVPDDAITQAARSGIAKVNIDTDLRMAVTAAVRECFANDPTDIEPMSYLGTGREYVRRQVAHKINILGSAGQAKACR